MTIPNDELEQEKVSGASITGKQAQKHVPKVTDHEYGHAKLKAYIGLLVVLIGVLLIVIGAGSESGGTTVITIGSFQVTTPLVGMALAALGVVVVIMNKEPFIDIKDKD